MVRTTKDEETGSRFSANHSEHQLPPSSYPESDRAAPEPSLGGGDMQEDLRAVKASKLRYCEEAGGSVTATTSTGLSAGLANLARLVQRLEEEPSGSINTLDRIKVAVIDSGGSASEILQSVLIESLMMLHDGRDCLFG